MLDHEKIARRALEIAKEMRRALPLHTDFADGWQQRYLERQNESFEKALEMARQEAGPGVAAAEAELAEMRQHGNHDDAVEAAAHLERVKHDLGVSVSAQHTNGDHTPMGEN